jgi:hypothetical protein
MDNFGISQVQMASYALIRYVRYMLKFLILNDYSGIGKQR